MIVMMIVIVIMIMMVILVMIAGVVTGVGAGVTDVAVGDHVGVGYYVDACLDCRSCDAGEENNCEAGITRTSCGFIRHGRVRTDNGTFAYGGRSRAMTVNRWG